MNFGNLQDKYFGGDMRESHRADLIYRKKHPILSRFDDAYWATYRFVRDIPWQLRRFRYAFIRAYKGWAPNDAWCMHGYLDEVMPEMLEHMADNAHGYPGLPPFETSKKWAGWLRGMAKAIRLPNQEEDAFYEDMYEKTNGEARAHYWRLAQATAKRKRALHRLVDEWEHLWD